MFDTNNIQYNQATGQWTCSCHCNSPSEAKYINAKFIMIPNQFDFIGEINISASISDFFGAEVPEYSNKIKSAKDNIIKSMISDSAQKGGNAIIGISYSFMTFSRDLIGISVNGTSVVIEPTH